MKTIIKVNGMMCAGCEKRVNNALRALEGVNDVVANAENHQVEVDLDDNVVTLDDIKETIEEIGYEVVQ